MSLTSLTVIWRFNIFSLGRAPFAWTDLQLEEIAPLSGAIWPIGAVHGEDLLCA
jgi:hypothetical protein